MARTHQNIEHGFDSLVIAECERIVEDHCCWPPLVKQELGECYASEYCNLLLSAVAEALEVLLDTVARERPDSRRMVWDAFRSDNQHERLRMDVLVRYLKDRATSHRTPDWDGAMPWLDNALVEHTREPFHAIITTARRYGADYVLCDDDLDPVNALWQIARTRSVARTAADYTAASRGLICAARKVVIVEPVFRPHELRFTATLKAVAGLDPIAKGR